MAKQVKVSEKKTKPDTLQTAKDNGIIERKQQIVDDVKYYGKPQFDPRNL